MVLAEIRRRDGDTALGRAASAGVTVCLLVILLTVSVSGRARAEYVPIDLGAAYNEYSDGFDDPYSPPRGFFTYYEDASIAYNGVPFTVRPATSPPTYNVVSTPVHETASVDLPVPHGRLARIYLLGVGTWLADYLGHQRLWCDDPEHLWFRVDYEDGTSEDLFPVDVETGLAQISDILRGEGAVESFDASPVGYVHMYELMPDDKVVAGLSFHDNCADPPGDFTILALTVETREPDAIVFHDDFSGTTIDPGKWRIHCRHAYPQHDGGEPWWLYTFWKQDDSLQLRVTHQNLVWIVARSARHFGEECRSYEVEVWQDDVSGWQDWPIGFITPYSKFGYYNCGWHWTIEWTGADGEHRLVQDVFPEPFQPWVHYRLKVAREGDELCWYIDNSDGAGYRLVYSTTDFSFPFLFPHPVYHIALDISDRGTTYYDNVVVRGRPSRARERIVFVSDRSGNRDVWIMEADGGNPQQLTTSPGLDDMPVPTPPNFWPTGSAIAYVSDDGNPAPGVNGLPNTDVWVMNPDGTGKRRLTNEQTAYCSQPQWSEDAAYVVYVKKRDGQAPEVWRVNVLTGTDVRLTTAGGTHKNPEWCGGYQIVYDQDNTTGWWDLERMNPDGSGRQPLATTSHSMAAACAHGGSKPEGAPPTKELAYLRVVPPSSEIRIMRADGADDRLIRDNSPVAYDGWGQVAWSPDDSLLAAAIYPSKHPGYVDFNSFVQIVDPATGVELFRTSEGRNTFALESSLYDDFKFSAGNRVWNENGFRLVFMSNRDGDWEIYTMAPDGSGQVNLTQNSSWDGSPCWMCLGPSTSTVLQVEIDIRPGGYPNPINLGSGGLIPVAVFSSDSFDATEIDPATVELAGAPVATRGGGYMAHGEDVDEDGLLDLVVQMETEELDASQLQGTNVVLALTGSTHGDVDFEGCDEVVVVPPDLPPGHWAYEETVACLSAGVVLGYDDDLYHPDWRVTRDQMAVYISRGLADGDSNVGPGPENPSFADVPENHWAYRHVEYAVANSVVQGYGDGRYKPGLELDRAQMAVFIARAMCGGEEGVPQLGCDGALFSDVECDFWARIHIEYIASQGVTLGYPDGRYHPEQMCSRDQMAVYVARAFGLPMPDTSAEEACGDRDSASL